MIFSIEHFSNENHSATSQYFLTGPALNEIYLYFAHNNRATFQGFASGTGSPQIPQKSHSLIPEGSLSASTSFGLLCWVIGYMLQQYKTKQKNEKEIKSDN
jgi:hypothetical protein